MSEIWGSSGHTNVNSGSCVFLAEDTKFSSYDKSAEGIWLETPTTHAGAVFLSYTTGYPSVTCRNPDQHYFLVKPVIDVPKINIEI